MTSCDLAVVGAGPAGLAAAALAARAGLATVVLDENPGPGGQVWRGIGAGPLDVHDAGAHRLLAEARASGAEFRQEATVWSLDRDLTLGVSRAGRSDLLRARRVILATGAMERPFPIPGWTLPGVMTAGAAQTLLKSAALLPAGRTVLAGQGPLLWLLAAQLLRAGGRIDAVLDTTDRARAAAALPHAWAFANSPYLLEGLRLMREVRRLVPVLRGVTALAALGATRLEGVAATARGRAVTLPADLLLLHQGVVPNPNLALAAGVPHAWDPRQLCWRPRLGPDGATAIPGLFVAGDGAGIAGVDAAVAAGRLAARAAFALGDEARDRRALARARRGRRFLDTLFQPAPGFRIPPGDTVVCRCEAVTARAVRAAVALGALGPNQLKAYTRAGMGPCQGRMCGLTLTELMAEGRGVSPAEIGHLRARAPVKPITVDELAGLPARPEERAAVERD